MWSSKVLAALAGAVLATAACAAPKHKFECPSSLKVAGHEHALDNASLFDGPPEKQVDLIPISGKTADRWDLTDVDPYLVCRYEGTSQVVTIHAEGAKACEVTSKPFAAYCTGR
ncbi:STY0301 family protein [Trinickia caryophylli]|uniref:Lipoprotein n=1 Tax=Trinickia caryophylli TaxID=28094 RepID=A0A1X7DHR5_TRICW|nr:STY0301 family protein [Trinickia caryophylli]PMS12325.1 hypothetical protein C0Z17_10185 [Trinickia caryophylli]TRX17002.1 hypothetical protein FNF07_01335 [Trinickia caryophylli]WQE12259.1 STY0301 family protein [Trinickia caryophylli]SMF15647.1 hypothetical protein SAMN06295900_103229 [Trinickia caryophylli]GLU31599.1 hypothetical protein Busp01_14410 [Trinickia caryophylli]